MDKYLEQKFEINNLKISLITNSGVLKIGTAGMIQSKSTNVPGHYVTLSGITSGGLTEPAVPMQAPIREID